MRSTHWGIGRSGGLAERGALTDMNTTKLIAHWTMSGERRDVEGRFRATDDIGTLIAENRPSPEPPAASGSFLIKGADEGGWQPLE